MVRRSIKGLGVLAGGEEAKTPFPCTSFGYRILCLGLLGSEVFEFTLIMVRASLHARKALVHNAQLLGRRVRGGHRQEHGFFLV